MSAKRWHDQGKSGWNTLLLFVLILGIVFFVTRLLIGKGDEGEIQYGMPEIKKRSVQRATVVAFHIGFGSVND